MSVLPENASAIDKWEFAKLQNIIDTADGMVGSTDLETYCIDKMRRDALDGQCLIEMKYNHTTTIMAKINAASAEWIANNPPPK